MAKVINEQKSFVYGEVSSSALSRGGEAYQTGVKKLVNFQVNTDFSITPRKGASVKYKRPDISDFYFYKGFYFLNTSTGIKAIIKGASGDIEISLDVNLDFNQAFDKVTGERVIRDRLSYVLERDLDINKYYPNKEFERFKEIDNSLYVFFKNSIPFRIEVEDFIYLLPIYSLSGHSSIISNFANIFPFNGVSDVIKKEDLLYYKTDEGKFLKLDLSDFIPNLVIFDEDLDEDLAKVAFVPGIKEGITNLDIERFYVKKSEATLQRFLGQPIIARAAPVREPLVPSLTALDGFNVFYGPVKNEVSGSDITTIKNTLFNSDNFIPKIPDGFLLSRKNTWPQFLQDAVEHVYGTSNDDIPHTTYLAATKGDVSTVTIFNFFDAESFVQEYGYLFVKDYLIIPHTPFVDDGVTEEQGEYIELRSIYSTFDGKVTDVKLGANAHIIPLSFLSDITRDDKKKINFSDVNFTSRFFLPDWFEDYPFTGESFGNSNYLFSRRGKVFISSVTSSVFFSSPLNVLEASTPTNFITKKGNIKITRNQSNGETLNKSLQSAYYRKFLSNVDEGLESFSLDNLSGSTLQFRDSSNSIPTVASVIGSERLGNSEQASNLFIFTNRGIFNFTGAGATVSKFNDTFFSGDVPRGVYQDKFYFSSNLEKNIFYISYFEANRSYKVQPASIANTAILNDVKKIGFFDEDKYFVLKNTGELYVGLVFNNALLGLSRWDIGRFIKDVEVYDSIIHGIYDHEGESYIFSFDVVSRLDFENNTFNCDVTLNPFFKSGHPVPTFFNNHSVLNITVLSEGLQNLFVGVDENGFTSLTNLDSQGDPVRYGNVHTFVRKLEVASGKGLSFRSSGSDLNTIGGFSIETDTKEIR